MNIEQQVCSLELSKRLHELGVKSDSIFVHIIEEGGNHRIICLLQEFKHLQIRYVETYNAYTAGELGLILPDGHYSMKHEHEFTVWDDAIASDAALRLVRATQSKSEADCRAKALIWLIENGYVKVEHINNEPI